jgi:hypothetical protein
MPFRVRRAEYFYATVRDEPGEGYKLLSQLADLGINLLAFTAVPMGPQHTQLTLVPEDAAKLARDARKAGFILDGPHPALLVQGDDKLGALAEIHSKLGAAGVNVYASSGVANGKGGFGYLIYIRPHDYERALAALGVG